MLGMACHHLLWKAHMVKQRRVWDAIISLGHHTRSEIISLGVHPRSNDVRRGMPSKFMDHTDCQMTSGMACHHIHWKTRTVGWCLILHVIIAIWQHTRSDDVDRGMPSLPLYYTHKWTMTGVACHHHPWMVHTITLSWAWMRSSLLGSIHGQTKSGRGMPT